MPALGQQRHVEIAHAVRDAVRQALEQARIQHVDAREHRRGAFGRRRLARDRKDAPAPVGDERGVGAPPGMPAQRERGGCSRAAVPRGQLAQVEVEVHVPVHEQDLALAQALAHRARSPAGAQDLGLVNIEDAKPEAPAAAERRPDRLGQVVQVHDDVAHAGAREPLEREGEERTVQHRQHRLRAQQRQRPHPQAQARGEDHRLHPKTMSPVPPAARKSPTYDSAT
jgi:hypothetical protein